jgi:hypothetical protein
LSGSWKIWPRTAKSQLFRSSSRHPGEGLKRRRVQPGHRRNPLVLSREVEDLLEHRQDHLDLVLGGDPLDVGGELPRIASSANGIRELVISSRIRLPYASTGG